MSQLKRIGDMIGSFVSNDFKRKRRNSGAQEEENSPFKKHKNSDGKANSLSSSAYLKRVSTFKDFLWCRDIPQLSPLTVSRYGWYSTEDEFMVRCVSCQENLSLAIPPPNSGIRESCIKTGVGRLTSAHAEFCPWSASPSPIDWTRVHLPDFESVALLASQISIIGVKLPYISSEVQKNWEDVVKKIDVNLLLEIQDEDVRRTSCILVLCGWRLGKLEDTLEDGFGVRRVGVWNFVSIQDEEDIVEAHRVVGELGHSVDDIRDSRPEGKEYFDPLEEHVSWHPLLQCREPSVQGWKFIINEASRNLEKETRSVREKREPLAIIRKVRDLLDYW